MTRRGNFNRIVDIQRPVDLPDGRGGFFRAVNFKQGSTRWDDGSAENWSATGGLIDLNSPGITLTGSGGTTTLESPAGSTFPGEAFNSVRLRGRIVSGAPLATPFISYMLASGSAFAGASAAAEAVAFSAAEDGQEFTLTFRGDGAYLNLLQRVRITFPAAAGFVIDIDEVAIEVPRTIFECRLTPTSASDALIAQGDAAKVMYRLSTPGGADIRDGDVFKVNDVYIIVEAIKRTSSGLRLEAVCKETDGGAWDEII